MGMVREIRLLGGEEEAEEVVAVVVGVKMERFDYFAIDIVAVECAMIV